MRFATLITCIWVAVLPAVGAARAAEPAGDWQVEDGSAIIRIDECRGALWGVVAWEKVPGRDNENPDPALRGRPTLGTTVLKNMRPKGTGRWEGQVYNARNGKTYDANLRLVDDNTLNIHGCVLGGIICGEQRWTRVATTSSRGGNICSRVSDLARRPH